MNDCMLMRFLAMELKVMIHLYSLAFLATISIARRTVELDAQEPLSAGFVILNNKLPHGIGSETVSLTVNIDEPNHALLMTLLTRIGLITPTFY